MEFNKFVAALVLVQLHKMITLGAKKERHASVNSVQNVPYLSHSFTDFIHFPERETKD